MDDILRKIGVLIIGPVAPPIGGMTVSLNNIITSKLKDRYHFYVLDVTGYRDRNGKGGLLRGVWHQLYLVFKLCRILMVEKPRIAHLQMTGYFYFYRRCIDIIICKLFGVKVIFHLRGNRFIEFYLSSSAIGKRIIKFMLGRCDNIIALSGYWHDFLVTIADPKRIIVVPNGVQLSEVRVGSEKRSKPGFSEDHVIIIFMGPIGRRKGAFDLLDAVPLVLNKVGSARFIFCGEGEFNGEFEAFKDSIIEKNLSTYVRCTGNVSGQEKYDYYLSSDIFVLPSHAENLPNSLLEAMASGLPVVVSDVGGVPELVKDSENGFLIKAGDVNSMADRIIKLSTDSELRKSMGRLNLELIKSKYDMPIIADKIDGIYLALVSKTRIAHVLYSFRLGGLEDMIATLINRMNTNIFSHSICVFSNELDSLKKINVGGVDVRVIKRYFRNDPTTIVRLAWVLRKINPDIVCTYNWVGTDGIIAAKIIGIKKIIHAEHGFDITEVHRKKTRRILMRRILLRTCVKVIAISQVLKTWLIDEVKLDRNKVLYIPNGCDTDEFHPGNEPGVRATFRLKNEDIIIGAVGSLTEIKDPASLMEAFAKVSSSHIDIKLMIIGDGPLRVELENLSAKLGVRDKVIFTGFIIDVAPFYRAMDIFALTSVSENMPLALLQAMSTSLPIVATDVGDVKYMLDGDNGGIVVKAKDVADIERALRYLLEHRDMAKIKGEFARRRAKEIFDISIIKNEYERLFAQLQR